MSLILAIYIYILKFLCSVGRLFLTNYALYFESLGVGMYEKAVRYDLATDMKQVIKPDLTGPLGARLFDKAVLYNSTSVYVTSDIYNKQLMYMCNLSRTNFSLR